MIKWQLQTQSVSVCAAITKCCGLVHGADPKEISLLEFWRVEEKDQTQTDVLSSEAWPPAPQMAPFLGCYVGRGKGISGVFYEGLNPIRFHPCAPLTF